MLTNPTGILKDQTHVVDSMVAHGAKPTAVFGPEHGFRGTAQAGGSEGDYADPRTGVPVYDAYGPTPAKIQAMFTKAGIDTVVFDIADVGARFYTYIWSMYRRCRPRRTSTSSSSTARTPSAARPTARSSIPPMPPASA